MAMNLHAPVLDTEDLEMRALTANGADLSDEQRARWDEKAEADALQTKIDRQAVVDDLKRRMRALRWPARVTATWTASSAASVWCAPSRRRCLA
jgi:hypothetical protein